MFIPKETIDQVRDRADIVDIIKSYVPTLKKTGNNYTGLCPFHKEKTPSFTVSPEKKIFHCFGCHTGGNVFTFISKMERIDFTESVQFIADRVGIDLNIQKDSKQQSKFDQIYRINDYAMRLYHKCIQTPKGKVGKEYLLQRGVTEKSINTFMLGYAPDSWDFLSSSIQRKKANTKLAEEIGLLSRSKKNNNHFYDRFRNRVIFPIINEKNKAIAFGGRVLTNDNPKYLNSPESEIFQKRSVLYGFNIAKQYLQELKRVIVVEGYLDVIGCHQAGINNVVAPLGTALTNKHLHQLSRYCSEIILLFDADSAGINATLRSLSIGENISVDLKVAMLPNGDPFDFITQQGLREFMYIVDTALKPIDFRIKQIIESTTYTNRVERLTNLFDVINTLEFQTERYHYLKKISRQLKESEQLIQKDFENYIKKRSIGDKTGNNLPDKNDNSNTKLDFITNAYKDLIQLLVNNPELIEKAVIDFSDNQFEDNPYGNTLNQIFNIYTTEQTFSVDKMFDFFQKGLEMEILNKILQNDFKINNPMSVYTEIFVRMKEYEINQKIKQYTHLLNTGDNQNHAYISEIEVLRREKEKLSSYLYNKHH